jgi:hypothetical protein
MQKIKTVGPLTKMTLHFAKKKKLGNASHSLKQFSFLNAHYVSFFNARLPKVILMHR